MSLPPGRRLGAYEIVASVGAGGMGEVYAARDTRLERRVALKLLPSHLSRDLEAIARLRREAFTLAALNHPNIAMIHGFEEVAGGETALVMELVEGETLSARLARSPMAVEEALQVCCQIAEALEAAHEQGIVHRDVKPGNVMIGRRGLVKVLDFGIARRADAIEALSEAPPGLQAHESETSVHACPPSSDTDTGPGEGVIVGTPGYMSPEQVLARPMDAASDTFALGVVLYECLTRHQPFLGTNALETLHRTLSSAADWTLLPANVSPRIRDLLARMLDKAPEARPASMRAVRLELENALGIRRAAALREGTSYATPNNLTEETSSFIGREEVLRDCENLMAGGRLLTLIGMGGSGKTRVAQRMARSTLDQYPDGVWFIDLSSVSSSDHVAEVAATALGVEDEPGRTPLEALVRHVRDRRMLFVIDNCESALEGARALVTGLLSACSGTRVLATSREPLGMSGETVFAMPALALPSQEVLDLPALESVESVRLFLERARAVQPDFMLTRDQAADVVEICRRLDGIPLALELAAARVRLLGLTQIRERIGNRFKLLARAGSVGPTRQQTLLATIQWSWDHLLAPEQDLMRRLAVFTGGWTLERATLVVSEDGDEFEVLDLLTRLVERSLVVVERQASSLPRYRFLESVHEFALEKLRSHADDAAMRERHLNAYLALAQKAYVAMTGSGLTAQIAELKPEEENILAALTWCEHSPGGAAKGLAIADSMYRFWTIPGRYSFGRRVLVEALQRDQGNPPSAARARALTRAAGLAINLGQYDSAAVDLEESLVYWRTRGDDSGLPAVLGGLGVVAMAQSRYEDALKFGEECLEIYTRQESGRGMGMALHNLGVIELTLARPGYGRERFERARALLHESGDSSTEALCLSSLASSCLRSGDREGARRAMRECLEKLAELVSAREGVFAIEAFAELLCTEGRVLEAARFAAAGEAARVSFKLPFFPNERADADRLQARMQAGADAKALEHAMAAGEALTLLAALAEAQGIIG